MAVSDITVIDILDTTKVSHNQVSDKSSAIRKNPVSSEALDELDTSLTSVKALADQNKSDIETANSEITDIKSRLSTVEGTSNSAVQTVSSSDSSIISTNKVDTNVALTINKATLSEDNRLSGAGIADGEQVQNAIDKSAADINAKIGSRFSAEQTITHDVEEIIEDINALKKRPNISTANSSFDIKISPEEYLIDESYIILGYTTGGEPIVSEELTNIYHVVYKDTTLDAYIDREGVVYKDATGKFPSGKYDHKVFEATPERVNARLIDFVIKNTSTTIKINEGSIWENNHKRIFIESDTVSFDPAKDNYITLAVERDSSGNYQYQYNVSNTVPSQFETVVATKKS